MSAKVLATVCTIIFIAINVLIGIISLDALGVIWSVVGGVCCVLGLWAIFYAGISEWRNNRGGK